jgi:hypothetical protein
MTTSIKQQVYTITTTGVAGSATGSQTLLVHGEILTVVLNFHASAPGTTDTTIAFADSGGNILVVTDSATDAVVHPRGTCVNASNSAITNSHTPFASAQGVTISLAQCDALTAALVATITYRG